MVVVVQIKLSNLKQTEQFIAILNSIDSTNPFIQHVGHSMNIEIDEIVINLSKPMSKPFVMFFKMIKIIVYFCFIAMGMIAGKTATYALQSLLIPDDCAYHVATKPLWFKLMYATPSLEGGHPVPNLAQTILFQIIGIYLSYKLVQWIFSSVKHPTSEKQT